MRELNSTFTLLQECATYPRRRTGNRGHHWWLMLEGIPVGYAKTNIYNVGPESFQLSDIEIRQAYQGRGYTRILTDALTEARGQPLYSTGNWTTAGARSLKHLPLALGYTPGIYYKDQVFIVDWPTLKPKYF